MAVLGLPVMVALPQMLLSADYGPFTQIAMVTSI